MDAWCRIQTKSKGMGKVFEDYEGDAFRRCKGGDREYKLPSLTVESSI